MSLMKYCRCGILISAADKYCPACMERYIERTSARMRDYDKHRRQRADVYADKRWLALTQMCKARFDGLDVWALIHEGKILQGTTSHHIIPVEDDITKAFELDNLVYLFEGTHKRIHKLYRESEETKRKTQEELYRCVRVYLERYKSGG